MTIRRAAVPLFIAALAGCVHVSPPAMAPVTAGTCRGEGLQWFAPADAGHRARLDAWCGGVGLPVIESFDTSDPARTADIGDITFVSWNVHVGNGDIRRFVRDLG